MVPAEKEPLDEVAVITGGLGEGPNPPVFGFQARPLGSVRSEIWDSRLWSKRGPELTHRQLRGFFGLASPPGNREVLKLRKSRGARGQRGFCHSLAAKCPWQAGDLLCLDLGFFLVKMGTCNLTEA